MAKRPRKPRSQSPGHPTQARLLQLISSSPPAAVAQRAQSWTVSVADELLEEFSGSPSSQAAELRKRAEAFEDGPSAALEIADEMKRRARAGVRFWPGSEVAVRRKASREERTVEGRQAPAPEDAADPPAPDEFG
jgi:hypothetical protein